MCESKEIKGSWSLNFPSFKVFKSESSKMYQLGFVRMNG